METNKKQNAARYGAGVVVGALLALGGVSTGIAVPDFVQPKPVIIEKIVEKKVFVERKSTEQKVYKVSVIDDRGKVVKSYSDITKFEFRIIGATLTNKTGKTFSVDGNISVEKVK